LKLMPAGQRPQVWHQAGRTIETAREAYAGLEAEMGEGLRLVEFIEDMDAAYAWADFVICRAGALTVAELTAAGLPSLLVPFPFAVDDHQTQNGQYLVKAGAALLIQESELDGERLEAAIRVLLNDRGRLMEMAIAARACAWPRATYDIVDQCLAVSGAAA
ncbi:MAG: glycosyltransferase, partial [Salinisphaeraceae bacterium]|nr:glycosyltransferase [Salinisphaeraceae bacterium]